MSPADLFSNQAFSLGRMPTDQTKPRERPQWVELVGARASCWSAMLGVGVERGWPGQWVFFFAFLSFFSSSSSDLESQIDISEA